jgi:cell pole-organizing protein PopZ
VPESKRSEPAIETPPPEVSARAIESETPKPAPPPPAPPADAVSAAAAAVARKVAATTSTSPIPTRPSFLASRAAAASGEGGRTLEDTVAEMLRPMLKQWLDTNMPRIVEKALKGEIADGANPPKTSGSGSEQS